MLPALGKPLVARTMERLYRAGIQNFTVVISENEGAVAAYLNQFWLADVRVSFIVQNPHNTLTQTLKELVAHIPEEFVLTTYDSFVHMNFPERLLRHYGELQPGLALSGATVNLSGTASPVYAQIEEQQVKSVLPQSSGDKELILANMAVCGTGFKSYLLELEKDTLVINRHLVEIFANYVASGRFATIVEAAWLLQMDADYDLLTLNKLLLDDGQDTHILSDLPSSVQITPPVRIDPQVRIGEGAKIGPRVYLESGCTIGNHAVVQNAVILQNTVVPADSDFSDVVVTTSSIIRPPA